MFFSLLESSFSSLSGVRGSTRPQLKECKISLQSESAPQFRGLSTINQEGHRSVHVDITTDQIETLRSHYYDLCSITIAQIAFAENYAFGSSFSAGCGGAICISNGQLIGQSEIQFHKNSAALGGALSVQSSDVCLENPVFCNNIAHKFGGAVYIEGYAGMNYMKKNYGEYIQKGGSFEENRAYQTGGAITAVHSLSLYLENVEFISNEAKFSGGALDVESSNVNLFACKLYHNAAHDLSILYKLKMGDKTIRSRGGGAIIFINSETDTKRHTLYTQDCCFGGNFAVNASNSGGGPGNDILFQNIVGWLSFSDTFQMSENGLSIGKGKDTIISIYKKQQTGIDSDSCQELPTNQHFPEVEKTSKTKTSSETAQTTYVPSPSTYSYVASPITRLPYPTTSSHQQSSVFTLYSKKSPLTVHPTLKNTPQNTLIKTLLNTEEPTLIQTFSQSIDPTIKSSFEPTIVNSAKPTIEQSKVQTIADTVKPTIAKSNTPTKFATIAQSFEPTMVPSASAKSGYIISGTVTEISASTLVNESSYISYSVMTTTGNDGELSYITYSNTYIYTQVVSYYVEYSLYFTEFLIDTKDSQTEKQVIGTTTLILIACGIIFVIFIVAGIGVYLYRKNNEASSESLDELPEDDLIHENDGTPLKGGLTNFQTDVITETETGDGYVKSAQEIEDDQYINALNF